MAIKRVDMETGEIISLSDRDIKAEVQELTGWDTAQYQREYDKFRNRLRNYEKAIGVRTGRRANEEFLRIQRKQYSGEELTAEQKAITQFTTAGTRQFLESVQRNRISSKQRANAFYGLTGERVLSPDSVSSFSGGKFAGLVQKSETTRTNLLNYLNEVVRVEEVKENGQLIENPIYRYQVATPADINKFLGRQAKELHQRQRREIEANRAYYSNGRKPGS